MRIIIEVFYWAVELYLLLLLARVIFDIVQSVARDWQPTGFILVLANFVYQVTEPPLRFLRRYIKPLQFGGIAFDVSFFVLYFGLQIGTTLLVRIFSSMI